MARELIVIKVPRKDAIVDKPISFGKLENLHLELLEIKKKLKKNLPPLRLIKKKPPMERTNSTSEGQQQPPSQQQSKNIGEGIAMGASVATAAASILKGRSVKENYTPPDPANIPPPPSEFFDDNHNDYNNNTEDQQAPNMYDQQQNNDDQYQNNTQPQYEEQEEEQVIEDPAEVERKEKEEYIWRFRILKKKHGAKDSIPEYNEHDDLSIMKTTYERTIKELSLDSSVQKYKMYLLGSFIALEYGCGALLGLDMKGFAEQQIKNINSYDALLVELGEKSGETWGSSLPVEIRLILLVLFNAGVFLGSKLLQSQGGGNMATLFSMLSAINGGNTTVQIPAASQEEAPKERKMRGPSVKMNK